MSIRNRRRPAGLARPPIALLLALAPGLCWSPVAGAVPTLSDPTQGTLTLVAQDAAALDEIDGLAFDAFGNLFGVLEVDKDALGNPQGGVVYVDKQTGSITSLISDIDRADQIAFDPTTSTSSTGVFFVTSESRDPASTTDRLFRVEVTYGSGVPQSATRASLTTTIALLGLEGLVVLEQDAAGYGAAGDIFVGEDPPFPAPHKVAHVTPAGTTTVLTPNADPANDLNRPEGMAFGDFGGALPAALYVAETSSDRVVRIDSSGAVSMLGMPAAFGLQSPDNLEFGPDGFLYVTEDRGAGTGRLIRIAADGTHSIFATGFDSPQGLAFDPLNGDLYISEQSNESIWRVSFATTVAEPASGVTMGVGLLGLLAFAGRRARRPAA